MSLLWTFAGAALWRRAYLHAVHAAFRTVPLYRERWALDGRTDPVLVPGRTGTSGGAITVAEAVRRHADLVPLNGESTPDPVHPSDLTLDVLCGRLGCGRWHLDVRRCYARETPAGLAFTLLWQASPRLVDIAGVLTGRLARCPWHGTPVVLP